MALTKMHTIVLKSDLSTRVMMFLIFSTVFPGKFSYPPSPTDSFGNWIQLEASQPIPIIHRNAPIMLMTDDLNLGAR